MASRSRGRSNNNNPEGRNQYSNGWMDTARERPLASAVTAAAAVGAGVFLWSRRNQISEQLSGLSEQISDWSESMRSSRSSDEFEMADSGSTGASMNMGTQNRSSGTRSRGKSQQAISEEALTLKETGRTNSTPTV